MKNIVVLIILIVTSYAQVFATDFMRSSNASDDIDASGMCLYDIK